MKRPLRWTLLAAAATALFLLLDWPTWFSGPSDGGAGSGETAAGDLLDAERPAARHRAAAPTLHGGAGRGGVRGRVVSPKGPLRATVSVVGAGAQGRHAEASCSTDAEGRFLLGDLPPGRRYAVTVRVANATRIVSPVSVEADRVADVGTIHIKTKPGIVGVVVDEQGRAVAGAAVWVARYGSGYDGWFRRLFRMDLAAETTSDEQGRFRFENVTARYPAVVAHAPGRAPAGEGVTLIDGRLAQGPLRLVLREAPLARGRVVRPDGTPVAGARVAFMPSHYTNHDGGLGRTGRDGRFAIPAVLTTNDAYVAVRNGRDALHIREWPKEGELTIVLPPDAELVLRVVGARDGKPQPGLTAQVVLGFGKEVDQQHLEGTTDEAGEIVLAAAEGWLNAVYVEMPHRADRYSAYSGETHRNPGFSGPRDNTVRAARRNVFVYRMPQPAMRVVEGVVRDASGVPIPGVSAGVVVGRHYCHGESSDEHGRYRIALLPEWKGVLQLFSGGFHPHLALTNKLPGAGGLRVAYDVTLERGLTITGRVVDERGRPVAGALVGAGVTPPFVIAPPPSAPVPQKKSTPEEWLAESKASFGKHWAGEAVTGPDGTYAIAGVPPGIEIVVGASHRGFHTWHPAHLKTGKGTLLHVPDVRLDPGASLCVRVLRPGGLPASNARVRVGNNVSSSWESADWVTVAQEVGSGRTDGNGVLRLSGLPYGRAYLEVRHPGTGGAKATLKLGRATETPVTLQLRTGEHLAGRLLDDRERPVARATVHVFIDESGPGHDPNVRNDRVELVSDAAGRFECADLPPRPITVHVIVPSYGDVRMKAAGRTEDLIVRLKPVDPALRDRREALENEAKTLRVLASREGKEAEAARARLQAIQDELHDLGAREYLKAEAAGVPYASCGGEGKA